MATATIETSQELREEATSPLVFESTCEAVIVHPLPFGPDEPVNREYVQESLAEATATHVSVPNRDSFLTNLLGRLAAFYDWLQGPPLSKPDRAIAQLIRARHDLHWTG